MEEQGKDWPPPVKRPPLADVTDKDWLHRRCLTGIKIALFGGLLLPATVWLQPWLDPNIGSLHPSLYQRILDVVFGIFGFLSLPVMLICETVAFVYGVHAWRCFTGKLAILAVVAAIGGNFLLIVHIWREGFI